jgi:adenylosuccinate synthase
MSLRPVRSCLVANLLQNLTKLDILDTFPTIKVCQGYMIADGQEIDYFPADITVLEACKPVCKFSCSEVDIRSQLILVS